MSNWDAERRAALGEAVRSERLERAWSKSKVSALAEVHRTTWDRIEAGVAVEDYTYAAAERVLGWRRGSVLRFLGGEGPLPQDAAVLNEPDSIPPGAATGPLHVHQVPGLPEEARALFVSYKADTPLEQLAVLQQLSQQILEAERSARG